MRDHVHRTQGGGAVADLTLALPACVRACGVVTGMDEASAQRHEHMLLNLNQTVMAGACFQFCVRQNFNVSPGDGVARINVSTNE